LRPLGRRRRVSPEAETEGAMRAGLAAAAVLAAAFAAKAAEVDPRAEPSVWLGQIYDAYHRAEDKPDDIGSAEEIIGKRASRALAALFKRDQDCVKTSNQICAIDWDFIINGQDWKISQVKVGPLQAAGDKATVTVTFKNMKSSNANIYHFVREGGDWKVDDIETHSAGQKTIRIAKWLKDYKDY
jgi:hypothetical protein